MKLREIAYSRSGDKGDISNIAVFPYDEALFDEMCEWLTSELVAARFADLVTGPVERYEFPLLRGFNFVLHGALGGGGSSTLRSDTMGKSYQSLVLDIDVPAGRALSTTHARARADQERWES
jgi:hypothetical protein